MSFTEGGKSGKETKKDYAGFWRRLGAVWIDSVVVYGVTVWTIAAGEWVGSRLPLELTALALAAAYGALLLGWRGQTVGKALLSVRITTREGDPIGYRTALLREVVGRRSAGEAAARGFSGVGKWIFCSD